MVMESDLARASKWPRTPYASGIGRGSGIGFHSAFANDIGIHVFEGSVKVQAWCVACSWHMAQAFTCYRNRLRFWDQMWLGYPIFSRHPCVSSIGQHCNIRCRLCIMALTWFRHRIWLGHRIWPRHPHISSTRHVSGIEFCSATTYGRRIHTGLFEKIKRIGQDGSFSRNGCGSQDWGIFLSWVVAQALNSSGMV